MENSLNHTEETIGEIVTRDYRKAQIFKSFGIDFCCGGKKTITAVCESKGIDVAAVKAALDQVAGEAKTGENDYLKWDIGFLTDYIINTHHQYVKENTAFIIELANKVARVHGDQHPELIKVAQVFAEVGADLMSHMNKEEMMLFPFIKELATVQRDGGALPQAAFGKVSRQIQMMEIEHEEAGAAMETICEITSNYTLPTDACNSYTILYKKLDEYENDLHRHVHLENNILFPKSISIETKLAAIN